MKEELLAKVDTIFNSEEPKEMLALGDYPISYPGLTLLYGLSGMSKSYSSVTMLGSMDYDIVFYLDAEGNSKVFKEHCDRNNVKYVNFMCEGNGKLLRFFDTVKGYGKSMRIAIIVDSFSIIHKIPVKETERIDEILSLYKAVALNCNISLIVIDHGRKVYIQSQKKYYIDIRGGDNKKKFYDVVMCLTSFDNETYTTEYTIEKTRLHSFSINDKIIISNKKELSISKLKEFLVSKNIRSKDQIKMSKLSSKQRKFITQFTDEEITKVLS